MTHTAIELAPGRTLYIADPDTISEDAQRVNRRGPPRKGTASLKLRILKALAKRDMRATELMEAAQASSNRVFVTLRALVTDGKIVHNKPFYGVKKS